MDGETLRYHPKTDGTFLLYFVGDDAKDDGGDPVAVKDPDPGFDWMKGRDIVWLSPATGAEIHEYFEERDARRKR